MGNGRGSGIWVGRGSAVVVLALVIVGFLTGPFGQVTPARASATTDLVKLGLESLYNSANSYECYQNPAQAKCKMGGIGDLFRYLASPEQQQQIVMLELLAKIDRQLTDLSQTVRRTDITSSQTQFGQLEHNLNGNTILQTMQRFNGVVHDCEGKRQPYAAGSVCEVELGNGSPSKFYESTLGKEIYEKVADVPPADILDTVQGKPGKEGLLQALPKVVSDRAVAHKFFNPEDSSLLQSYFEYYVSVETAYITLWSNYWESRPHVSTLNVAKERNEFIDQLRGVTGRPGQLERLRPLPDGTTFDMRTGLMWTTHNPCVKNSLTSPASCGIHEVGGIPLKASCPATEFRTCELSIPLRAPYDDAQDGYDVSAQGAAAIEATAQTDRDSSWKVPSQTVMGNLLRNLGPDPLTKLQNDAHMFGASQYALTSTMWCGRGWRNVSAQGYWECQSAYNAPFRVIYNLSNGSQRDVPAGDCGGRPCGAEYIFYREVPATEYEKYGIVKHW